MSVSIDALSLMDPVVMENGAQHLGLADNVISENGFHHTELLPASNDDHGGLIVELKEPMDSETFSCLLKASLSHWRKQGKKGIWIKLPNELANLYHAAIKEGFWPHHAEPNYVMLVCWIPKTANTIPANASHRVGIVAIVMNARNEVLVVQEKCGRFQGTGIWKFPTGVVEAGEHIPMGAVREVKEETGIDTEFVEILAFRQSHKAFFEKSDLSFLCMLRPLSFDITKQDLEIEAAQWMPFEEYAAQPIVKQYEYFKYINDVWLEKVDGKYSGFSPRSITSVFSDRVSYLYVNTRDLD